MKRTTNFPPAASPASSVRLDKWLWAARFYKTRSLATEEIGKGRVLVNELVAKASREVRLGDVISMRQPSQGIRTIQVLGLSGNRAAAAIAQTWYAETPESLAQRLAAAQVLRQGSEPALSQLHGRPTKRDRRDLAQASQGWGSRWSASVDD
ncbi:MAG: RNA-binding S4 domain-containing protein [Burkholderiales bacterium]